MKFKSKLLFQSLLRFGLFSLLALLFLGTPTAIHAGRVERAAFQTEHFEYLIDTSKTEIIPYLTAQFERSYQKLTAYFGYQPDKRIHVLFLDEDDFSNGYAFSAQGWVVIFLPQIDFDLRGKTAWLPNVISHELTHVITLRKMGETSRFLGFQLLANLVMSKSSHVDLSAAFQWYNTPAWFAEGLAQFGSQVCGRDTTDTFRQMILETAHASNHLLPLPAMVTFGWDGRKNEMIYTQGYFLTHFLFNKYGRDKMNMVLEASGRGGLEAAFQKILLKSSNDIYSDWIRHLDSTLLTRAPVSGPSNLVPVSKNVAYINQTSPLRSADSTLAYLSSQGNDFGITDLYIRHNRTSELVKLTVDGPLNLTLDGKKLLFTSRMMSWKTARLTRDLYQYDFTHHEIMRLTWNGRITAAAMDEKGTIYTLSEHGGKTRFSRLEKNQLVAIADFPVQVNVSNLTQGGQPGEMLVETSTGRGSDLYSIHLNDGHLTPVLATQADERDPRWNPEQGRLWFSANYTGTYQIYSLQKDTLLEWTHDGKQHLKPFQSGGVLYNSTYSAAGFLLDSMDMNGLKPRIFSPDSLLPNVPFSNSPPPVITAKKWGDDGMKYLGYSAFAQLSRARKQRNVFETTDSTSPLYRLDDAGGYFKWTGGGAGIWMHPGQESQVYLEAGVSDEMDNAFSGGPYLSQFLATYSNASLGPMINGSFETATTRLLTTTHNSTLDSSLVYGVSTESLAFTLMRFTLYLDWQLGNYLSMATFGNYSGVSLKGSKSLLTNFAGGGSFFGEQIQAVVYQPGVNFPNQLLFFQSGIGYQPEYAANGTTANWNLLTMATNTYRFIFYRLSLSEISIWNTHFNSIFTADGSFSFDIPASLKIPFPNSRTLLLTDLLPSVGLNYFSATNSTSHGSGMISKVPNLQNQPWDRSAWSMQSSSSSPWSDSQIDMLFSLTLKMVSPLKNLAYWNFYYALPIQGLTGDPYFGLSLSL